MNVIIFTLFVVVSLTINIKIVSKSKYEGKNPISNIKKVSKHNLF